ncbi:MAG: flagellar biosynthesis protein FliQ [Bacteroidetes bacterium]|jgi:flagellar biosynthetic protein FliQ|nr:flagellar biosynthesis protein FliQ [Bacteroidota bacterium]
MTQEFVIGIARNAFYTILLVSAPVLVVSIVVGLIISIFQAATSINEMTLTFVPKIIAIGVVLILMLPFMMQKFISFAQYIFNIIPTLR